jgi:hypothetical protein
MIRDKYKKLICDSLLWEWAMKTDLEGFPHVCCRLCWLPGCVHYATCFIVYPLLARRDCWIPEE